MLDPNLPPDVTGIEGIKMLSETVVSVEYRVYGVVGSHHLTMKLQDAHYLFLLLSTVPGASDMLEKAGWKPNRPLIG